MKVWHGAAVFRTTRNGKKVTGLILPLAFVSEVSVSCHRSEKKEILNSSSVWVKPVRVLRHSQHARGQRCQREDALANRREHHLRGWWLPSQWITQAPSIQHLFKTLLHITHQCYPPVLTCLNATAPKFMWYANPFFILFSFRQQVNPCSRPTASRF